MDDRKLDALREHFDGSDLPDVIGEATWDSEIDSDPMIVTSIRLPKSLLDWVREQAVGEQLKPTALIRRWIEDQRRSSTRQRTSDDDDTVTRLAERVSRLEAVALRVVAAEQEVGEDSMADLLTALRASVEAAKGTTHRQSDQERRGA